MSASHGIRGLYIAAAIGARVTTNRYRDTIEKHRADASSDGSTAYGRYVEAVLRSLEQRAELEEHIAANMDRLADAAITSADPPGGVA